MAKKKLPQFKFKPDPTESDHLKIFQLTKYQRNIYLKWACYSLLALASLLMQDTMFSRIRIGGATTDLFVGVVLLVAMLEGAESGGLFALLASLFYHFSGSAPGVYVVLLLTAVAIFGSLFRQGYWTQCMSSTLLCSFFALAGYELLLMVIGIFMELTVFNRVLVFLTTALLTTLVLIPLYYVARGIGQMGGELWKE